MPDFSEAGRRKRWACPLAGPSRCGPLSLSSTSASSRLRKDGPARLKCLSARCLCFVLAEELSRAAVAARQGARAARGRIVTSGSRPSRAGPGVARAAGGPARARWECRPGPRGQARPEPQPDSSPSGGPPAAPGQTCAPQPFGLERCNPSPCPRLHFSSFPSLALPQPFFTCF